MKHLVCRTDTDSKRTAFVRIVETLRDAGIDAEYETGHSGNAPRVNINITDGDEYASVLQLADAFETVEATCIFYETEDDLRGTRERKSTGTVAEHDSVRVVLSYRD